MTTRKRAIRTVLFSGAVIGLSTVIIKSVLAGPQNRVTAKDAAQATADIAPEHGSDERTQLPHGDFVAGNGVVEPHDREVRVAGEVAGRIAQLVAKEGQFVTRGSVLVELAGDSERALLAAAEAEHEQARAELARTLRGLRQEEVDAVVADTASLRARAELTKASLARVQTLATTGAATPEELDRATRQAETDQSSYDAAEARRRAAVAGSRAEDILIARAKEQAALARVKEARAHLERLSVRAPADGEILQIKVRPGEHYALDGNGIAIMGDTRTLRVRADIDERDVSKVGLGAKAFVTLNAFPGRRVPGRVVEIGRRMGRKNLRTDDPVERIDTKILEVVVELEDKQGLVPGLRVIAYVEKKS